jgi:hypothetical protein
VDFVTSEWAVDGIGTEAAFPPLFNFQPIASLLSGLYLIIDEYISGCDRAAPVRNP